MTYLSVVSAVLLIAPVPLAIMADGERVYDDHPIHTQLHSCMRCHGAAAGSGTPLFDRDGLLLPRWLQTGDDPTEDRLGLLMYKAERTNGLTDKDAADRDAAVQWLAAKHAAAVRVHTDTKRAMDK